MQIRAKVMYTLSSLQDFNRDMDEYESGFGDVFGEHWIGFQTLDKY